MLNNCETLFNVKSDLEKGSEIDTTFAKGEISYLKFLEVKKHFFI